MMNFSFVYPMPRSSRGAVKQRSSHTSRKSMHEVSMPARLRRRCSALTALSNSSPSEWAEITHPFHPLRGQCFPISKTMCVSGVDTLVLRTSSGEAFAIARDWTDHAEPSPLTAPTILDGECLLDLATLLESLSQAAKKELDK